MFEINREQFGQFIAILRKEKGLTQKELAQQLFISDKAVSKWETGKSIPDITLLIPLSELLEVSVTELLECRRITQKEAINTEKTEELVKKVIGLSEEETYFFTKKRKKQMIIYLLCFCFSIIELFCLFRMEENLGVSINQIFITWILSVGFGCYFWIFMKEKLPSYYDEHKINVYVDGILHMNLPGIYFNNNNWIHIVKVLRIWSIAGMLLFPLLYTFGIKLVMKLAVMIGSKEVLLFFSLFMTLGFMLGGLFISIIVVGRKYQYNKYLYNEEKVAKEEGKKSTKIFLIVLVLFVCIGVTQWKRLSFFSGTRVGYLSKETKTMWTAEYKYLNGYMKRTLVFPKENEEITVKIHTEEGAFSVSIKDKEGNVVFEKNVESMDFETDLDNEQVENVCEDLEVFGTVTVEIEAKKHKGSFEIGL